MLPEEIGFSVVLGGKNFRNTHLLVVVFSGGARFIEVQTMVHSRRGREWAGQRVEAAPRSLFIFLILPRKRVLEKSRLSVKLSSLFPGFSWGCACALSHVFPGFSRACALLLRMFPPGFPMFCLLPFMVPIVARTEHELSERNPLLNQAYQLPGSAGFLPFYSCLTDCLL